MPKNVGGTGEHEKKSYKLIAPEIDVVFQKYCWVNKINKKLGTSMISSPLK
jgi:hypothetical protein